MMLMRVLRSEPSMPYDVRHVPPTSLELAMHPRGLCPELERHPWLAKALVFAGLAGCGLELAMPPIGIARLLLFVATTVVGLVYSLRTRARS